MKKNSKLPLRFLHKLAQGFSTKSLVKISGLNLITPLYHTISDNDLPHIKHLYPVKSSASFIKDLDFLLKTYHPISLPEYMKLVINQEKPVKPSFLLTFDDGLSEFYSVIAPILEKKGIPAVCFLNSGFIDNKELFFRFKASLIIDKLEKTPSLIKSVLTMEPRKQWKKEVLSITYNSQSILDDIAQKIDLDFNDFLIKQKPYLSSEQITSLISRGFYFGGHSIDHPQYTFLDLEEQIRQTKLSVDFVADTFKLDYKVFAFPFTDYGVNHLFFDRLSQEKMIDLSFGCAGFKNDTALKNQQRIAFESNTQSAKEILHKEFVNYMIKKVIQKDTIIRND